MAASLQECTSLGIHTPADALEFIGKKVRAASRGEWQRAARRSKVDEARELLAHVLLAHVSVVDYNFWPKVVYIAQMLRRMIYAEGDASYMDDMDYYGNKRLELAGQLLSLLFEDLFKKLCAPLALPLPLTLPLTPTLTLTLTPTLTLTLTLTTDPDPDLTTDPSPQP